MTSTYKPGRVPDVKGAEALVDFLRAEFAAIARAEQAGEPIIRHQVLHQPPAKALEGDEVEADGTNWNPGSGRGKYVRRNGAWNFDGFVTANWQTQVTGTGKPTDNADVTATIMGASGTSIKISSATLFKTTTGLGGVFIGSGGLVGKDTSGNTTFSINGTTGDAFFQGTLDLNGTNGLALTSGTAVGKIKLDASSNLIIQGTASNKSVSIQAPNGGGLSVDDFTTAAWTRLVVSPPGGVAGSSIIQNIGGQFTLASSTGNPLNISAGLFGADQLNFSFGSATASTALVTGLNADKLDGNDASAFAAAGHNHAGVYLPVAGTSADSSALGGVAASGYTHVVVGDTGTATAAGSGLNMVMGTGLSPTYQVACSSNNIVLQAVSDATLKQDIADETLGMAFIKVMRPRRFRFISDSEYQQHGFIAQEVAAIATPNAEKDALAFTNPDGKMGINHLALIGPMVKAIQELEARVHAIGG